MADAITTNVMQNGFRNAVIRLTNFSDGTGETNVKKFDATSTGAFGVTRAGSTLYPGIHTKIWGMDYDVQDMKIRLQWEATVNQDILALGGTPESFDWRSIGGLTVPPGLAGATGSILLSTFQMMPASTYSIVLKIWKDV